MKKLWLLLFVLLPVFSIGQNITTVAGGGTTIGDGGPATAANLLVFGQIAFNSHGDLIIAANNDKRVRKVDAVTGIISTIGGTGTSGYSGDGGPATAAAFNWPNHVICDQYDNIYVADHSNRIRKIDALSGIVTTIAGNGLAAFVGDGGTATAASINGPEGMVFDALGNMFFVDVTNARIRKISTAGIITTVAGSGISGYSGDGGAATAAKINPWDICFDNFGKLYITDNDLYVRKIDLSTGIITTVVGYGSIVYNGEGIAATAAGIGPSGIFFDASNNMFVADASNNRVRIVNSSGIISTAAGTGVNGFSGDGGPATAAQLYGPYGLKMYCGNLYIADGQNRRVRKVAYHSGSGCPELNAENVFSEKEISIYPNPATTELTISAPGKIKEVGVYNLLGQIGEQGVGSGERELRISVAGLSPGIYFVRIVNEDGGVVVRRFVKE